MKMGGIAFGILMVAAISYVGWHIYGILPFGTAGKVVGVAVYLLWMLTMVLYFTPGLDAFPVGVSSSLYRVSTSWIFVFLYLIIIFLVLDICSLCRLLPKGALSSNAALSIAVTCFLCVLFVLARVHYSKKVRVEKTVLTSKPIGKDVKIVLLSDLHFGYNIKDREANAWVDLINAENPDLVLIGGDIIDGFARPLGLWGADEILRRINAPIYACFGNHEYYTGIAESTEFYRLAGIRLLRDSSACPLPGIRVIGRDDRTNSSRRSLSSLVGEGTSGEFTILLDHQPYDLSRASDNGIDFQFSGHTHYGQVWPVSWIERLMYEQAFGPYRIGNTEYYVTSGMGIWGPRWRIGTRSEYLVLNVKKGSAQ